MGDGFFKELLEVPTLNTGGAERDAKIENPTNNRGEAVSRKLSRGRVGVGEGSRRLESKPGGFRATHRLFKGPNCANSSSSSDSIMPTGKFPT